MKDYTDITILLDRSGSMESIKKDMEGAFNAFISSQKKQASSVKVSLFSFANHLDCAYEDRNIDEVPPLKIEPRGGTALFAAMVQSIDRVGARLAALPEDQRPQRVLFVAITDGDENQSPSAYTAARVHDVVSRQSDTYNWQFLYLGANQDAFTTSRRVGIDCGATLSYTTDAHGMHAMQGSLIKAVSMYTSGKVDCCTFTEKDQDESFTTMPSGSD